ncbi:CaiB/BaiF CoA transferase family protein [Paraburkholderia sabiae]|uniref:CaiB/BaiF CoA-transferase family protein n=1 Tax=Paraburkholderia sabiae TaxID=273251 RepID=A0ABU9QIY5_9BURK|nr:CaiB/BaiF CoA-transferase family protein [Paraburkholderia sabiae]WJZ77423.1 CaiB/BaiF CoA-transferase family protein [Paraburkholderia sabiae]CAD6557764.1 Acetyl-CoA:oxalate CoA-transferase [Paraburkholderia sabiae]
MNTPNESASGAAESGGRLPLQGIKVVSLCHYLQGPAAVQYLADMGAEVTKIEPRHGAFERHWSGANVFIDGVSGFYLAANRNCRSVALDLKTARGREIVLKLVAQADVVVDNFRTGVMERLGLGEAELRAANPGLIIASATGFGASGPLRDSPGQDLLVQARTGLIAATGHYSTHPSPVGCAPVDQHGASLLAMGILGAYIHKLRTGEGTRVESSLFNAGIDLQQEALANYYSGGFQKSKLDRAHQLGTWFHAAPYGVYRLADGKLIAISNVDPVKFAKALESEDLMAIASIDRHVERDRYAATTARVLSRLKYSEVSARFDEYSIWYAPVNTYDELFEDPQARHNEVFESTVVKENVATLVRHPISYNGTKPGMRFVALSCGEHTEQVLHELGYSNEDISALSQQEVVALGAPQIIQSNELHA